MKKYVLLLAVCLAPLPGRVLAQEQRDGQRSFEKATTQVTPLAGNVSLIQVTLDMPYNTVVLTGSDGLLMVDHTDAPAAARIGPALKQLGDTRVKYLINTHWHYDHVGGNEVHGKEALVIAHDTVRRRLMTAQKPWWSPVAIGPYPQHAWPVLTFNESLTLHLNGEEVQLWHFGSAHTDGDTVVYFRNAKTVVMGDLFHGRGVLAMGQDPDGLAKTLAEVLQRITPGAKVVTGHAGVTGREDLAFFQEMQAEVVRLVRSAQAAGKSEEEIKQIPLPERFKSWWPESQPKNIDRWMLTTHRGLLGRMSGS